MVKLRVIEIKYIAYRLARETMTWDEPIPSFDTRFPNILEQCLVSPFQTFEKKTLYRGLISKSGILFYLLIKNHPFQNGNKRLAITILLYFLYKNNKWLKIDNIELYRFAKWVAESNPRFKTEVVAAIEKFVKTYLISR